MNRNAIALSLGLLVGPALAQGAIAQGALPAIHAAQVEDVAAGLRTEDLLVVAQAMASMPSLPASNASSKPSNAHEGAPTCSECGMLMVPNGACYKCGNCGSTSGCS